MESIKKIATAIKSGHVFGYVKTVEHERTIDYVKAQVESLNGFSCNVWGIGKEPESPVDLVNKIDTSDGPAVWILKNFNWFLDSKSPVGNYCFDVMQAFQDKMLVWRSGQNRKFVLIVSSASIDTGLPKELVDYFVPFEAERPGTDEVRGIYERIQTGMKAKYDGTESKINKGEIVKIADHTKEQAQEIVLAAKGMTTVEIEDAFAWSFVESKKIDPAIIRKIKAKRLDTVSGIEYGEFGISFADVVGYEQIKERFLKTVHSPLAKGFVLVGPPGCGKTMITQACAAEVGRACLVVKLENIFGSLVGETYEKANAVIDVIKAMSPCLVLWDEMEKGMAGVGSGDSGGNTGNEITKRAMSIILKFMSEPNPGIFNLATVNSIEAFRTAPEYLRAGRWDSAPFYVGLPNLTEQEAILSHYMGKYEVKGKLVAADMFGWSGAEIEACCKMSMMTGESIKDSAQYIKPIAQIVGKDYLERLESWAENNAIPASKPFKIKKDKVVTGDRDISI